MTVKLPSNIIFITFNHLSPHLSNPSHSRRLKPSQYFGHPPFWIHLNRTMKGHILVSNKLHIPNRPFQMNLVKRYGRFMDIHYSSLFQKAIFRFNFSSNDLLFHMRWINKFWAFCFLSTVFQNLSRLSLWSELKKSKKQLSREMLFAALVVMVLGENAKNKEKHLVNETENRKSKVHLGSIFVQILRRCLNSMWNIDSAVKIRTNLIWIIQIQISPS